MRIDRSLESIDLTKLAIFSLIFVAFALVISFAVIIPIIDKHKVAIEINSEKEINLAKINQLYNENLSIYENLNLQNTRALNALKNGFNEMKFISVAGKYFNNLYLSLNSFPHFHTSSAKWK